MKMHHFLQHAQHTDENAQRSQSQGHSQSQSQGQGQGKGRTTSAKRGETRDSIVPVLNG